MTHLECVHGLLFFPGKARAKTHSSWLALRSLQDAEWQCDQGPTGSKTCAVLRRATDGLNAVSLPIQPCYNGVELESCALVFCLLMKPGANSSVALEQTKRFVSTNLIRGLVEFYQPMNADSINSRRVKTFHIAPGH